MVSFIKTKTVKGFSTQLIVESRTLSKEVYPNMNRRQRRDLVFASPVAHLVTKISALRQDLVQAGIEPVPFPGKFNSKVLSGHMSQLMTQALT